MDRLIWTAWRAFWVGLGASAVLITQSLLAPPPAASTQPPPSITEPGGAPMAAPARAKDSDPLLSRSRFDGLRGKTFARIPSAS